MEKLLTFVNVDRYLDFAEVRNDFTYTFSLVDKAQAAQINEFAKIQIFKGLVHD